MKVLIFLFSCGLLAFPASAHWTTYPYPQPIYQPRPVYRIPGPPGFVPPPPVILINQPQPRYEWQWEEYQVCYQPDPFFPPQCHIERHRVWRYLGTW